MKWLLAMLLALACGAVAYVVNRAYFLPDSTFYDTASVAIFVALIVYIVVGLKERHED